MIGLSLSLCVKDIALGLIKEQDVDVIITSTKMNTVKEAEDVLRQYSETYWRGLPDAANIAQRIEIYQPRLQGLPVHNIADGWWVEDLDEKAAAFAEGCAFIRAVDYSTLLEELQNVPFMKTDWYDFVRGE